ncbi:MAG: Crp/Fnr family transcriptional regulator [Treponema sp.]|jgi:CRP-like cAMP-binding protein|nr:Crp/Fnr family transcriptional regulator [Treponema sp.]
MTVQEALTKIEVIAAASSASHAVLAPDSAVKNYKKGEHIFFDKEETGSFYGVLAGTAAIYKMSSTFEKRGMFIYGAGALLNEESIDGKPASVNAELLRDSQILRIRRSAFLRACVADPALSKAFMDSMAMNIRRLYHLMKNTSNNLRGDRRIAAKLWKLSRDHGVQTEAGIEISFDLSITALAEFLGSQRETVSRQVKTLCDNGLVIVKNSRFIIPNRKKLLNYFEDP